MKLDDIVRRQVPAVGWAEGQKIPWHDEAFSERMLKEHLSQGHDLASRRFEIIDAHVEWIHKGVLSGRASRILDLGCGPGLYLERLAKLGHECVGIDYGPASIAYARQRANEENLTIQYKQEDVRSAEFGRGFDLVMLIFGEFNVFKKADTRAILLKAHSALTDKGSLLLEPHTFEAVEAMGRAPRSWYSTRAGLFSDKPHLCLQENFWDESGRTAITRWFIVDAASGDVARHAQSMQAYTQDEYRGLLEDSGFSQVRQYPSLSGTEDQRQAELMVLLASKQQTGRAGG